MSVLPKVPSRASGLASVLKKSSGASLSSQVWLFLTNPAKPGPLFGLRLKEILRYTNLSSGRFFLNEPCKARPPVWLPSWRNPPVPAALLRHVCLSYSEEPCLRFEEIVPVVHTCIWKCECCSGFPISLTASCCTWRFLIFVNSHVCVSV